MPIADKDVPKFGCQCRVCSLKSFDDNGARTKDPANSSMDLAWLNLEYCDNCDVAIGVVLRVDMMPGNRYARFAGKTFELISFWDDNPEASSNSYLPKLSRPLVW